MISAVLLAAVNSGSRKTWHLFLPTFLFGRNTFGREAVYFLQRRHDIPQDQGLHTVRAAAQVGPLQRRPDAGNQSGSCLCNLRESRHTLAGRDGLCVGHMGQKFIQQGIQFPVFIPAGVGGKNGNGPVANQGVLMPQKLGEAVKAWIPNIGGPALLCDLPRESIRVFGVFSRQAGDTGVEVPIQISTPSQWSISCWMIWAVQPVKVLKRVWNCSF